MIKQNAIFIFLSLIIIFFGSKCSNNKTNNITDIEGLWELSGIESNTQIITNESIEEMTNPTNEKQDGKIYRFEDNKLKTYRKKETSNEQILINCPEKDVVLTINNNEIIFNNDENVIWSYTIDGDELLFVANSEYENSSGWYKVISNINVSLIRSDISDLYPIIELCEEISNETNVITKAIHGGDNCTNGNGCNYIQSIINRGVAFEFTERCNRHDRCFSAGDKTYGMTCKDCDDYFYDEMKDYCNNHFGDWWEVATKAACKSEASVIYAAVRTYNEANNTGDGGGPYRKANEPEARCCNFKNINPPPPCWWETATFDTPCDIPGLGLNCCE
jgi:hypothetical protein